MSSNERPFSRVCSSASNLRCGDKAEAKSLLKQFLADPVVAAIIGGLASTL